MQIAIFSECYHPIENGVVASIDALCDGLRADGHDTLIVAPSVQSAVCVPSLPLPTRTAYRLVLPLLDRQARAHLKNVAIIHTHSPFVTGWMGLRYARRLGLPLVFTYHTQLEEYAHYVPFERSATRRAASTLTRTYANLADTVIVPTPAMESRLRELGVSSPIAVVPTGIDAERFAAGRRDPALRARLGAVEGGRLVLLVSRLAREKNIELAIRALAMIREPQVRLVLAGDGPERPALEEASRSAGVAERVVFLGHVPRESLPDLYASCDAFVFPSVTETQGLVLAEAFGAGLPVVAIDNPQTRDVFGTHLAGELVHDAAGMAAALRSLLTDPARRHAASAHSRAAAAAFDATANASRVLAVYQAVHANRAGTADMSAFEALFDVVDPGQIPTTAEA